MSKIWRHKNSVRVISAKMPESGLPKICLSIKAKKNLAKIVKINFFKALQLTNSLQ